MGVSGAPELTRRAPWVELQAKKRGRMRVRGLRPVVFRCHADEQIIQSNPRLFVGARPLRYFQRPNVRLRP